MLPPLFLTLTAPALAVSSHNALQTDSPTKPIISTSIKPLSLIATQLLGTNADVRQLLPDNTDPHHQQLKFSQLQQVEKADLVIWFGPPAEAGLQQLLGNRSNSLQLKGTLTPGHGIAFADDPHIWLNPDNALLIAQVITARLITRYPAQEQLWQKQLTGFKLDIDKLNAEVSAYLLPYLPIRFIAEHNAFNHFARHFGLVQAGSFRDEKGTPIGARAMGTLLQQEAVDCLITESNTRLEKTKELAKHWGAVTRVINPLGAGVKADDSGYSNLIRSIARQFARCKNTGQGPG